MVNEGFKVLREAEDVKNLMLSMWVEVGRVRLGDSITDPESQDV
jgi:hypothetical protein